MYRIDTDTEQTLKVLSFEDWRRSVLDDINRMSSVSDHLEVFYETYQILESACEERMCRCSPLIQKKANTRIGRIPKCNCTSSLLQQSGCFYCELWMQKTIGTGYPPRCTDCGFLFPVFSIRLRDLPEVYHPTLSYTPHCSRKIIDFEIWKLEVNKDNYQVAFWYNKMLAECIIDYTNIQLYDIETTYPEPDKYLSLNLNEFMRETLYKRYVSWTQFIIRWNALYKEFDLIIKGI